jgi:hypothetical protein
VPDTTASTVASAFLPAGIDPTFLVIAAGIGLAAVMLVRR